MSTTLYEGARVNLTRFCGPANEGPDRRRYQLGLNLPRAGVGGGMVVPYAYAVLTREELRQVAEAIHGAEASERWDGPPQGGPWEPATEAERIEAADRIETPEPGGLR